MSATSTKMSKSQDWRHIKRVCRHCDKTLIPWYSNQRVHRGCHRAWRRHYMRLYQRHQRRDQERAAEEARTGL